MKSPEERKQARINRLKYELWILDLRFLKAKSRQEREALLALAKAKQKELNSLR